MRTLSKATALVQRWASPVEGSVPLNGSRGYRLLGFQWALFEKSGTAYLQGPGIKYREFPDLVVLKVWGWAVYRRVGWVSVFMVGPLCLYRRIGDLRSWRPSFKTIP